MSAFAVAREIAPAFDAANRRWLTQPDIGPCWRGDQRVWNLDADSLQKQLYCSYHKVYVNPNGFACQLCTARQWPDGERVKAAVERLRAANETAKAEDLLVQAVESGILSESEAVEIAHDAGLV